MLAPVRIEAPADLVVSVEEVKQHLRVDFADDDSGPEGSMNVALIGQGACRRRG